MQADWIEIKRGDVMPQYAGVHVSMNPKGEIVMNAVAYRELGSPGAFLLLYDAANHRIGLRPAERSAPNAYPALKSNRTGIMVRAHRLLREQRIILPLTMQFDKAEIDTDGILILDLRTARPSRRALGRGRKIFCHE
jgi:hypothetical protein